MSRCEKCGGSHPTAGHELATFEPPALRGSFDVEALVPFERRDGNVFVLIAAPQKPFLPRGLMLWDVGLLNVSAALIGRDLQLVCAFGDVPARWFNVQKSFEAVVLAQSAGDAAGWGHWTTCYPGQLIQLRFDGPASRVQALMWGHTP